MPPPPLLLEEQKGPCGVKFLPVCPRGPSLLSMIYRLGLAPDPAQINAGLSALPSFLATPSSCGYNTHIPVSFGVGTTSAVRPAESVDGEAETVEAGLAA